MTCDHGPRSVHFPGGQALLTANGNWTAIYDDHPGEVFQVWKCPGCSVELWGLAGEPTGPSAGAGGPGMMRRLVGLVILQGLDLTTTWHGLEAGAMESNPVGAGLLGHGFSALVLAKALATVAVAGIAWFLHRDPASRQLAQRGLMAGCGLMVAVVGWNAWVIMLHA